MRRTRLLCPALLAVLLISNSGRPTVAAPHRETVAVGGGSLELTLPDLWGRVPDDALLETLERAAASDDGRPVMPLLAAFRPRLELVEGGQPLLLVYSRPDGRIPWTLLADTAELDLAGEQVDGRLAATGLPMADALFVDHMRFDRERFRLRVDGMLAESAWGPLTLRSAMLLTELGSVTLQGMVPFEAAPLYEEVWNDIFASAELSPDLAYRPRLGDRLRALPRRPSTWYGAAAAVAAAALVLAWRDRRRRG